MENKKNLNENVFDLIENGDLVRCKTEYFEENAYYTMEIINNLSFIEFVKDGIYSILAIYKLDEKGNYIKVWEKKNERNKQIYN